MTLPVEKARLTLGFIPLTDCAPLAIAVEKGYFARYGLDVALSREVSWANIRDKVAVGLLDGAQMLAPMPIATTLGLGGVKKATLAPLSLDLNGSAVTVSTGLFQRLRKLDPEGVSQNPISAAPLKRLIEANRAGGSEPMILGMVFPFSTHNYMLRYWLAAAGIDPDRDLRLWVVPPPYMADRLAAGDIAGYCVGEPWNASAVAAGAGHSLLTDYDIWNNKPEKVLGVNEDWAAAHPNTLTALIMALLEACRWLDEPDNRAEAAAIVSGPDYVDAPEDLIRQSLMGEFHQSRGAEPVPRPDYNVFFRYAATFPWRSHAIWLITQMYRWGQIEESLDIRAVARQVYRPDLYRTAAEMLGMAVPAGDEKSEGRHAEAHAFGEGPTSITLGPDRFCDGGHFDPADPVGYLRGFDIANLRISLDALAEANS